MLTIMNTAFTSGVSAFQAASARLEQAASGIARARETTIPAASSQDATPPRAVAGQSSAPPPPAEAGGRALSSDASIIEARVEMIRANQQAALAATSIRAASDMVGELLDVSA
jgi:hypothetical protein